MEDTRAALQKWVETRKLISQEQKEWRLEEQLIQDRIRVYEGEISDLRTRIAEMKVSITESQGTEQELTAESTALKASAASLRDRVTALEAQVNPEVA